MRTQQASGKGMDGSFVGLLFIFFIIALFAVSMPPPAQATNVSLNYVYNGT